MEEEWKRLINYYRLPMITTVHYEIFQDLMESTIIKVTSTIFRGQLMYQLHARTSSGESLEIIGQMVFSELFTFFKNEESVGSLTKSPDIMFKNHDVTTQEKAIFEPFMQDLLNFMVEHYNEETEQIS